MRRRGILTRAGTDDAGVPIVVVAACRIPACNAHDMERLFHFVVSMLDDIVELGFNLVFLYGGVNLDNNQPEFSWLKRLYSK